MDIKQATNIDFDNIGPQKGLIRKTREPMSLTIGNKIKIKEMSVLLRLLSLPLHRLFSPPVVEDEFIK